MGRNVPTVQAPTQPKTAGFYNSGKIYASQQDAESIPLQSDELAAMGMAPKPSMYDPAADLSVKRRRKLAELLMKQGQQPDHTEMVSGVAVKQSPLGGIARMLTQGLGGYQEGQADKQDAESKRGQQQRLADAISKYQTDPTAAASILAMGSPEEQTMAFGMDKGELDYKRDLAKEQRGYAQARAIALLRHGNGGGGDPDAPNDPSALANNLGVPAQPVDTRGLTSKDASMYQRQQRLAAQKQLQDDSFTQAGTKAANNINDANRFQQLMETQDTGGWRSIPGVGGLASMVDPEMREMSSIQDRLAPQQRAPGSGSSSDVDVRMFKNALPSYDKPKVTNENIIAATVAREKDVQQYQSFLSDYLTANGHVNGAQKAWHDYQNANPIFDPTSTDANLKLNKDRKDYKTYFQQKSGMNNTQLPYQAPAAASDMRKKAEAAISKGADPAKVRAHYEQITGEKW